MKILLVNHGSANNWGGGDGVQMRETSKRLINRGHEVDLVNSDTPEVEGYDLVHIFNCRVQHSFIQQMRTCLKAKIPTVVSPIWISIPKALWGSRGTLAVIQQLVEQGEEIGLKSLEMLKGRKLTVQLPNGTIDAQGQGTCDLSWMEEVGALLKQVDGLLTNSWLELKAVQNELNWCGDCFEVAPYGVDPSLFLDADPNPFRESFGIKGPFIVQGGRIEPAKNQAMLCWALRHTNLPLVLIGSSNNWPAYSELCKKIYGDQLKIIDHISQPLLASAFAAASVHVLPSWMETCGLVTLEAALTGTPVVGSNFGHELEYLRQETWWCDPADPNSISTAVQNAWNAGKTHHRPVTLKRRILEEFNWERTTDATEKIYNKVLKKR
ncbi:glycosyltransferase family 4 protein [Prochlorococcus sp. MIT 1300]|uniref:glycosyltransferase family 4 protein n=1 Tax=Prochlorococcus sp. MIT 1300 TaxID=3096218 RepID=UPI002A75E682|nr:glycosyltransferase family 4 protein [Prochlorococcus sp. MIT 1300]